LKEKNPPKRSKRAGKHYYPRRNDPNHIYEDSVRRAMSSYIGRGGIFSNLFRLIDACRKPRLLLGGPAGSGKTRLVAKPGAVYDFVYPDSRTSPGKHEMPAWFFSERAICIDAPGALCVPERWGPLCAALKKYRFGRRRAADGLLLVVDLCEILTMDPQRVNQLAAGLREQADTLVSATGYNVPLYFIFSKTDAVEGCRELFSDKNTAGDTPELGALFGDDDLKRHPVKVFSQYCQKMYEDVTARCQLKMLESDSVDTNRRLCRFQATILLAEAQISALLTEFFKRPGRAAPHFRGFFLTSTDSGSVLDGVIPRAKFKIREAGAGTPGYLAKKISFHALMATICAIITFGIAGSGLRDALHMRTLKKELSTVLEDDSTIENQYAALEKLRMSHNYLQGTIKSPGRLLFGTGKARGKIMGAYIAASEQMIVKPVFQYLEASVAGQSQGRAGEEEHKSLYGDLKAYLLLTGGNNVKAGDIAPIAETIEHSLKEMQGARYRSLDKKVVGANINAVIKLAAEGRYQGRADPKIVSAARQKLAAAPRADAVYAAAMSKLLQTQRGTVPIAQIVGQSESLRYSRDISVLYTRGGWEQAVYEELVNAAKDPFMADWVMGPVKTRADEAKLLPELVTLYSDDLCRHWLDFIRNVHVSLPADIPSLSRGLERLSSRNSETGRMLAAVCSLATQPPAGLAMPQTPPMSAGAIKEQIANVSNKLRGSAGGPVHGAPDPFAEARKIFGALDTFLSGGGFDEYTGTINALSQKLKQCDDLGSFAPVFLSRGDDPIKTSRNTLTKAYAAMPPATSAAIKRALESPLDVTAGILTPKISAELEESWNAEAASPFHGRLAQMNPFNKNGADLSWSDFEEFFKPKSGALWKYRENNLAGLMERTPKGWERTPARSLSMRISVNDDVINTYNRAEKITAIFFKADGTAKRQNNTFYPFTSHAPSSENETAMREFTVPGKVLRY